MSIRELVQKNTFNFFYFLGKTSHFQAVSFLNLVLHLCIGIMKSTIQRILALATTDVIEAAFRHALNSWTDHVWKCQTTPSAGFSNKTPESIELGKIPYLSSHIHSKRKNVKSSSLQTMNTLMRFSAGSEADFSSSSSTGSLKTRESLTSSSVGKKALSRRYEIQHLYHHNALLGHY